MDHDPNHGAGDRKIPVVSVPTQSWKRTGQKFSSMQCQPGRKGRKEMEQESTLGLISTLSRVNDTILESQTGQNCKYYYQGRVAALGMKIQKENQQAKNGFLCSSHILAGLLYFTKIPEAEPPACLYFLSLDSKATLSNTITTSHSWLYTLKYRLN